MADSSGILIDDIARVLAGWEEQKEKKIMLKYLMIYTCTSIWKSVKSESFFFQFRIVPAVEADLILIADDFIFLRIFTSCIYDVSVILD